MRTIVVIPAYDEERTVGEVVRNVREYVPDVVVVDDGSTDATGERARHAGAAVITHCINRGLGAALGTGIAAALSRDANAIVTLDADGQHDPADIAAVIAPVQAGFADVVIGVRWSSVRSPFLRVREGWGGLRATRNPLNPPYPKGEVAGIAGTNDAELSPLNPPYPKGEVAGGLTTPFSRRAFNAIANLVTRLLFGVSCSDTQSGFRAFSRSAASLIEIRTNRMEVSSEILAEAARLDLRIAEVPIRTIYTTYSMSKGQSFGNGIRTAWSLVLRRFF